MRPNSNILFIASNVWTNWGGSEKMWVEIAENLKKEGHKIGIYTKKWDNIADPLKEIYKNSNIYYFENYPSKLKDKFLYKLKRKNPLEIGFIKTITSFKPDLVIISQGGNTDGLRWMEYCLNFNIPYITISQAAQETNWFEDSITNKLEKAFKGACLNLFVSKANKSLTEKQIGVFLNNAKVVANPYNVKFNNDIPFIKPQQEKFILACVARFELHAKGQDVLIETLALDKWKKRNLYVNLYGNGLNKNHIQKLINLYGVSDKLTIKGYEETSKIWETNQGIILPSRYEGLPLALVEAMLCARFPIVTDVSGNTEVIEDNFNGFIASAPNAKYLDEALERAWQRRHEWELIGKNASNSIKKIIPEEPIQEIINIIKDLELKH